MPDVEIGFWGRIGGRFAEWRAARLRFVDNWRSVVRKAWTMRISFALVVLGTLFLLMSLVSSWMTELVGPVVFSVAFMAVGITVGVARLFKQPGAEDAN